MKPHLAAVLALALVASTGPSALAAPGRVTELAVKGPVRVELSTTGVDVTVKRGAARGKARIVAELRGGTGSPPAPEIDLDGSTLSIDGLGPTVHGTVTIEVPAGSSFDAHAVDGDLVALGLSDADVESVTGAIRVEGTDRVEAESVSGSLTVVGGTRHRLATVSGPLSLSALGATGAVDGELETVSGSIAVQGACGRGCRVTFDTRSGEARLALDRASSFVFAFETFSGRLDDTLGIGAGDGQERSGRLGKGEGRIKVKTFSGAVALAPLAGARPR
jgi:hypothetical protein